MRDEEKEEIPYVPKPVICVDPRKPKITTKKPNVEKITTKLSKKIKYPTDEL